MHRRGSELDRKGGDGMNRSKGGSGKEESPPSVRPPTCGLFFFFSFFFFPFFPRRVCDIIIAWLVGCLILRALSKRDLKEEDASSFPDNDDDEQGGFLNPKDRKSVV